MSSFTKKTKNPRTGKMQRAAFIDDYYGSHIYGVGFKKDGTGYTMGEDFLYLEFFREEEII